MSFSNKDLSTLLIDLKSKIKHKRDKIHSNFDELDHSTKADNTPVSEFDLYISDLFKQMLEKHLPKVSFFSEEDQQQFKYPVCILDPLDGTKEFLQKRDDCVVSFGIYYSDNLLDPRNFSWIYNPNNEFEVSSMDIVESSSAGIIPLKGFVSRTEFRKDLYKSTKDIEFEAVGSIAYKLALLAKGECDFVITKRPKHIWDICAGTHICLKQNISHFQNGLSINILNQKLINPYLLWCHKDHEKFLVSHFNSENI